MIVRVRVRAIEVIRGEETELNALKFDLPP
jgi:hypothetical protein